MEAKIIPEECEKAAAATRSSAMSSHVLALSIAAIASNCLAATFNEAAFAKDSGWNFGLTYALIEFAAYAALGGGKKAWLKYRASLKTTTTTTTIMATTTTTTAASSSPSHWKRRQGQLIAACGILQALGHGLPMIGLTKVDYVTYTLVKSLKVLGVALVNIAAPQLSSGSGQQPDADGPGQLGGALVVTIGLLLYAWGDISRSPSDSETRSTEIGVALVIGGVACSSVNGVLQQRLLQQKSPSPPATTPPLPPQSPTGEPAKVEFDLEMRQASSSESPRLHATAANDLPPTKAADGFDLPAQPSHSTDMVTAETTATAAAVAAASSDADTGDGFPGAIDADTLIARQFTVAMALTLVAVIWIGEIPSVIHWASTRATTKAFCNILGDLIMTFTGLQFIMALVVRRGATFTNAVCNLRRVLTVIISIGLAWRRSASATAMSPGEQQEAPSVPYDWHQILGAAAMLGGVMFMEMRQAAAKEKLRHRE